MQIHFIYLLLENGISYYHNIDPIFKDQFQDELFGNILSAFQSASKHIFKSQICKIQLDTYSIVIREFICQNIPVTIIVGTDLPNILILNRFTNQFVNMFQSLLQFFNLDLNTPEITSEFRKNVDLIYDQLRQSVLV